MKKRMSIDTLIDQNVGFNTYTYSESTPYAEGIMDQSRDFFNRNSRQAKFISKFIVNKKVDLDKMSSDEALEYLKGESSEESSEERVDPEFEAKNYKLSHRHKRIK